MKFISWEGTDGTGAAITEAKSPAPVFVVVDADGKFEMQVDCDPDGNSGTAIIDVVTGFVDVRRLAA